MLPKTTEYALRAAVWLAQEAGRAHASEQIAEAIRVPRRYVHRVLQSLVRAGIVRSQPGPHGGYSLSCSASDTTLLDVIRAIGPLQRIRSCPLGLASHSHLCPLHSELDEAFATMERAFARVTIADVVNHPSPITALREIESPKPPAKLPRRVAGRAKS